MNVVLGYHNNTGNFAVKICGVVWVFLSTEFPHQLSSFLFDSHQGLTSSLQGVFHQQPSSKENFHHLYAVQLPFLEISQLLLDKYYLPQLLMLVHALVL